jgi:hypothetical protein
LKAIAAATFKKPPEKLIKALSAHSTELQDLSDNFERTTVFTQHVIEICTYYETKTTRICWRGGMSRRRDHYRNIHDILTPVFRRSSREIWPSCTT